MLISNKYLFHGSVYQMLRLIYYNYFKNLQTKLYFVILYLALF